VTGQSNGKRIRVVSTEGIHLVTGIGKADRSLLAQHHNAIRAYLRTGDTTRLERFVGRVVGGLELETRTNALDWWGLTGELAYESIYGDVV
jgi:hypothetical protein